MVEVEPSNSPSPTFKNMLRNVTAVYNRVDGTTDETAAEDRPIEFLQSYGIDIPNSPIDHDEFEEIFGEYWTQAFAASKINRELAEYTEPVSCWLCKITVGVFVAAFVNEAVVATRLPGAQGVRYIMNARQTRTRFVRFWTVFKSFVEAVGITVAFVDGIVQASKASDKSTNDYFSWLLDFACSSITFCNSSYTGYFTFTNKLGWSIHNGSCSVQINGDLSPISLDGLSSGCNSEKRSYSGSITDTQTWTFYAYTSGGDDGYLWKGHCEVEMVGADDAEAVEVIADAYAGTFSVVLSDGRLIEGELVLS